MLIIGPVTDVLEFQFKYPHVSPWLINIRLISLSEIPCGKQWHGFSAVITLH